MKTKRCGRCRKDKPVAVFGSNRARRDGLAAYCKGCSRTYQTDYLHTHPEQAHKAKMRAKDWRTLKKNTSTDVMLEPDKTPARRIMTNIIFAAEN